MLATRPYPCSPTAVGTGAASGKPPPTISTSSGERCPLPTAVAPTLTHSSNTSRQRHDRGIVAACGQPRLSTLSGTNWNAHEPNAVARFVADDVVVEAGGQEIAGQENVKTWVKQF